MRILHTSDWHIGRTFHKHPTFDALGEVFDQLIDLVRSESVDVVVASGDIFDTSTPSAQSVEMLDNVLIRLADTGAKIVMISGNHDSPARLGAKSVFAHDRGVHVLTDIENLATPVTIDDEHGPVHFYGVPYIEPALQRHRWADADSMRSQKDAIGYALGLIRADAEVRGGRSVVLAHTFVQGADGQSCDSERDIVGGVDKVPVDFFTDFDYAALGHIHGRATLADTVRYCGAPLHFSFSEAGKPRGGWLVDLDAAGMSQSRWLDFPVPRPLSVIRGTLEQLLSSADFDHAESHWVRAEITDQSRPLNAQRRLRERFAFLVELAFQPVHTEQSVSSYAATVKGKSDLEIAEAFYSAVRNGVGLTDAERDIIDSVLALDRAQQVQS